MKTYLQLVNDAIEESGTTLDSLSSSDFASPTDQMQVKFKKWVADAYDEICTDRDDWQFLQKVATFNISPRLYVKKSDALAASTPTAGATYTGAETGVTFDVVGTTEVIGTWAGAVQTFAFMDIEDLSGQFKLNETFTPDDASPDIITVGYGRYDFNDFISDLREIDLDSVFVQDTGGSTNQTNTGTVGIRKLEYYPWKRWVEIYEMNQVSTARPYAFTCTPDGLYDFYPRPDIDYTLHLSYSSDPTSLSAYDDTPSGIPERYEDMIMWRALMFYAEFDESPGVLSKASKRYYKYKDRMEKNEMPLITFGKCIYDY